MPVHQYQREIAKLGDAVRAMRNKQHARALAPRIELSNGFLPEPTIAGRERLVDQVAVKIDCKANPESQARTHARAISLDFLIEIAAELGELVDEAKNVPRVQPMQ